MANVISLWYTFQIIIIYAEHVLFSEQKQQQQIRNNLPIHRSLFSE